jgi:hypothetical protein
MSQTAQTLRGPVVVKPGQRVPAEKLSTKEDSGWRALQKAVSAKLQVKFVDSYGAGITRVIRVLCDAEGQQTLDSDGNYLLDDGKSSASALHAIKARLDANTLKQEDLCPNLQKAFSDGVLVDFVYYPDGNDQLTRIAFNCRDHDEDENEYLCSHPGTKIALVKDFVQTIPGGKYEGVVPKLTAVWGIKKKAAATQWVAAAKVVPQNVLDWMDRRVAEKGTQHGILQGYIFGNQFLVGKDRQRLPGDSMIFVFDWLALESPDCVYFCTFCCDQPNE